jgi:hypothetical protein
VISSTSQLNFGFRIADCRLSNQQS